MAHTQYYHQRRNQEFQPNKPGQILIRRDQLHEYVSVVSQLAILLEVSTMLEKRGTYTMRSGEVTGPTEDVPQQVSTNKQ